MAPESAPTDVATKEETARAIAGQDRPRLRDINWPFTLKSTLREFNEDGLTDAAAGLTYFSVLSLFPALIALVSILSLFGQGGSAIQDLLDTAVKKGVLPSSATESLAPALTTILNQTPAPGLGLVMGIVVAAWSASNYVKAFGRALNKVYETQEGRGAIKLNLQLYGLTLVLLLLIAMMVVLLAVSGPIARVVGDSLGLGDTFVMAYDIIKIPVLLAVAVVVVALLYNFAPNVKQHSIKWMSVGAITALVLAALASVLLGIYLAVAGNASYAKTYGALAGVIIFLFWLWVMNTVLLFGAELDAELERTRQLQIGIAAERDVMVMHRDTAGIEKQQAAKAEQERQARELREHARKHGPQAAKDAPIDDKTTQAQQDVKEERAHRSRATDTGLDATGVPSTAEEQREATRQPIDHYGRN